ncbi:hypothetical protein F2S71_14060 [Pseudomonas syringae pv. actinidiae]|nr:hypothetical protein [Pseudomonas syringae pv. actinidiae]
MTDFNLAALANLSDADLMMPLTFDDAAAPVTLAPAVTNVLHFGADQELPDLADLLAKADAVVAAESVADLPSMPRAWSAVPASGECVRPHALKRCPAERCIAPCRSCWHWRANQDT